jgi:Peptidase family M48
VKALKYHHDVVAEAKFLEPELWTWFAEPARLRATSDQVRADLLRSAYRVTVEAHPELITAAEHAATAVGVTVPVSVFQMMGDGAPNAALVFVPDEAIMLLYGSIVELLSPAELLAVFGHELAHHRLWSMDDSSHLIAERMFSALSTESTDPIIAETLRRLSLTTELFADRGALLACGELHSSIRALVSATTSMRSVNAEAYLAQAEEVIGADTRLSSSTSHPETFLRALALRDVANGNEELSSIVNAALFGPIDLDRLDVLARRTLEQATRSVIEWMLSPVWMRTETILSHARTFFADLTSLTLPSGEISALLPTLPPMTDGTQRYLCYVLADLATVDSELEDAPLQRVAELVSALGLREFWEVILKKDLRRKPAEIDALKAARHG